MARRRFGIAVVLATLFLIFVGAEVKSREAGLSVPDWPLSYGMWMPPMVGNVFYEHGHRMVAATVGMLTVVLALWTSRRDPRRWARRLAWLALATVVVQGLLGGLTVLLLLPTAISMTHGTLAQSFLCIVAWLAYANSREWHGVRSATSSVAGVDAAAAQRALRWLGVSLGAVFVQLVLGAWMRHSEAGLAVPFFPLSETGGLLPEHVDRLVVIHMIHRGFAVVVAACLLAAALRARRVWPHLGAHAAGIGVLVLVQVVLGASVIWTAKAPVVTSTHVATGAALLVATWLLALRAWRASHAVGDAVDAVPVPEAA